MICYHCPSGVLYHRRMVIFFTGGVVHMAKKLWLVPEIVNIDLSKTEYNKWEGTTVDGIYQDWETCEKFETYKS